MKFYKYLLIIALGCSSVTFAAHPDIERDRHEEELDERDDQNLRRFLETKRDIDLKDKAKNLTISGDVRTEWRHLYEKRNDEALRGRQCTKDCRCIPLSHNDFDIEFNLRFDYRYKNARAYAHIQYDNSAGIDRIDCSCTGVDCKDSEKNCTRGKATKTRCKEKNFHGSGACDDVCLKRAYIGYTVFENCGVLDIEIGRRMLYDVLESELQYTNRMDGVVLKYSNNWKGYGDWYIKGIGFLIDERVNHFAYAVEAAIFNIMDWKLDAKYSLIDWRKWGRDRCGIHNPKGMRFLVSQWILTYHFNPKYFWDKPAETYAGLLYNHQAHDHHQAHDNQRWGGYWGFSLGEVKKAGDWAFNIEYQILEQRCVAFDDQGGIGLGNVREDCCDEIPPTVGFQGLHFEILYAITDNLTINFFAEGARDLEDRFEHHRIRHRFSKVELEAIYAF